MNSKDLTIAALSTTAVILLVGLLLVQSQPTPVYASGMGDSGGDYIVLSGELSDQQEILYVIDTAQNRMLTYRYDVNAAQVERAGCEMLDKYFDVPWSQQRGRRPRIP